jgi:5S rRNA maturation endonuclease (ribonuclease M5)
MNIKQVKEQFTLKSLLSSLGHHPDDRKSKGNDLWYKSPFRPNENTASFHIDASNDIYKDFGDAEKGGDIIWFAQMFLKYHGMHYGVSDTLKWFDELKGITHSHCFNRQSHSPYKPKKESEAIYKVLSDKEIFSSVLFTYLKKKGLSLKIAKSYLRQIYFLKQKSNKKLFGLGFKTRGGGFDIRTANSFKTMIGNKDISIIKGINSQSKTLDIFEGASDFLTMLTILENDKPMNDVIVLNSANLYRTAAENIKENKYSHIRTWFDNDEAGKRFEIAFKEQLENMNISVTINRMNSTYEGFKDLNVWHTESTLDL